MRKLLNIAHFNPSPLLDKELDELRNIGEAFSDMYRRYENHTHKGRSCPYSQEANILIRRLKRASNKVNQAIWKNLGK